MEGPTDKTDEDGQRPAIDLGPYLEPGQFLPGRYAAVIQRTLQGTHAVQRLRENSTASFVLELAADGTATACRGWRYHFNNDGPQVHTEDRFNDQQGYRGRHTLAGRVVEVELASDDTVCSRRRESPLELARSAAIKLRCVVAAPKGHPTLRAKVLLCQWLAVSTGELQAHLVPGLVPDGWMVLGTGNGLRIKVTGQPPGSRVGAPTEVAVEPAPAPIGPDAWETPL